VEEGAITNSLVRWSRPKVTERCYARYSVVQPQRNDPVGAKSAVLTSERGLECRDQLCGRSATTPVGAQIEQLPDLQGFLKLASQPDCDTQRRVMETRQIGNALNKIGLFLVATKPPTRLTPIDSLLNGSWRTSQCFVFNPL
jgi:hypothetical protein